MVEKKAQLPAQFRIKDHWDQHGKNAPVPARLVRDLLSEMRAEERISEKFSMAVESALKKYGF